MASLGNGYEDGIGLGAPWGHAAAGDLALEDSLANDVLAEIIMAGAAGQHREGQDAAPQALDRADDSSEDGIRIFPGQELIETVFETVIGTEHGIFIEVGGALLQPLAIAQDTFEPRIETENGAGLGIVLQQAADLTKHVGHASLAEQTVHGIVSAPRIGDEHARKNSAKNLDDDRRAATGGGVIVGGCFIGEGP